MLNLISEKSMGGDISEENLTVVQRLAKQVIDLYDLRKMIEEHIEEQMKEIAPNVVAILGTAVGARILARAGSLKKLATMPASTIQVLGAEKALFRAIKTGAQPPKHGLLFQHPLIHAAPRWQRGKIARAIAAKAAIAARVDVYGGSLNKTLLEKLNIRVDEIDKKYKDPPKPKPESDVNSGRTASSFRAGSFRHRGRGSNPRQSNNRNSKSKKTKKRKKFGR